MLDKQRSNRYSEEIQLRRSEPDSHARAALLGYVLSDYFTIGKVVTIDLTVAGSPFYGALTSPAVPSCNACLGGAVISASAACRHNGIKLAITGPFDHPPAVIRWHF